MAELVDAPDLGSGIARCGGSSPLARTEVDVYTEEIQDIAGKIAEIIEEGAPSEIDKLDHDTLVEIAALSYELVMAIQAEGVR